MRELVDADIPFERSLVPLDEARELFTERKMAEKVRLLKFRQKGKLVLYSLLDHRDYHYGYMVPSTGYLRWFDLRPMNHQGFVLQFPRRHAPKELLPMPDYPKLLASFRQYGKWLERLGIENVGALNDVIRLGIFAKLSWSPKHCTNSRSRRLPGRLSTAVRQPESS